MIKTIQRRDRFVFLIIDGANDIAPIHHRARRFALSRHQRFFFRDRRGLHRACLAGRRQGFLRRIGAGWNRVRILDAVMRGGAARQRIEFHRLQKADQRSRVGLAHGEFTRLFFDFYLRVEGDEPQRDACVLCVLDQGFAALGLFDLAGPFQQRFQIAIDAKQFGGGFHADAAHAGHIVDGVAGQRLNFHNLVRKDTELLHHLGGAEALVLHCVEKLDLAVHDQLHQILVGGDDGAAGAGFHRHARIGGDEVVRLEIRHLHACDPEGARGVAHQRKLRDQIFRRIGTVRLVLRIDLVAERGLAGIEDHGEMRRRFGAFHVLQELPQHVAVAGDGACGQAVGFAGQRRQRVIGAEEIARSVDQVEMIALLERRLVTARPGSGFRHGFRLALAQCAWAPARSTKRRSQ